jgi:uncharacterized protein DUF4239
MSVSLPLAFVAVLGSAAAAVLGLVIVRWVAPLEELEANHVVGGIVFGLIGTSYAVLLSFVIVISWSELSSAQSAAAREASDLGSVYWLVHGFPSGQADAFRGVIGQYARSVVNEEWPLMANGEASDHAWALHDELWRAAIALTPATADDQQRFGTQYSQLLTQMTQFDEDRRLRLVTARSAIPRALWVVLIAGVVSLVPFTYMFGTKRILTQAIMTGMLAGMLTLSLVLVAVLEHPYAGLVRVAPTDFQSIVDLTQSNVDR